MPPTADDFQEELDNLFATAQRQNKPYIDVLSGDLHRTVGGYPSHDHRMPTCCQVMKNNMRPNDRILDQPPKGKGATLKIRYYLPR